VVKVPYEDRETAARRLKDPVMRQAVSEIYSCSMFCFESDKDEVNSMGVLLMGRMATLLFGDAKLSEFREEELIDAAQDVAKVPDDDNELRPN
jgi:hypothetical protein